MLVGIDRLALASKTRALNGRSESIDGVCFGDHGGCARRIVSLAAQHNCLSGLIREIALGPPALLVHAVEVGVVGCLDLFFRGGTTPIFAGLFAGKSLKLAMNPRVGFTDQTFDLGLRIGSRLAVEVEQCRGELAASPVHRALGYLQIGDVAVGVDLEEDTMNFAMPPHRRYCLGEQLTVVADLGDFSLKLPLPFLDVCSHCERRPFSAGTE